MLRKDAKSIGCPEVGQLAAQSPRCLQEQLTPHGKAYLRFITLYIFYLLSLGKSSEENAALSDVLRGGVSDQRDFNFRFAQSFKVLLRYSPVGDRFMHRGNVHNQR